MIIFNQDKTVVLNMNNIDTIYINDDKPIIVTSTIGRTECLLGEYKTRERAKQVLEEIVAVYRCSKTCESSITEKLHARIAIELNDMKQATFLYEMPKE